MENSQHEKPPTDTMKKKTRQRLRNLVLTIAALLVLAGAGIYAYQEYGDHNLFLNFDVVDEGKIYRSGQPRIGDIKYIHEEYNLGTIFVLYGSEDGEVKKYAREHGIKVVGISIPPGGVPTEKQLNLWYKLAANRKIKRSQFSDILTEWPDDDILKIRFPLPVLIHCKAGSDRAGVMVALYRIQFEGWLKEDAKREMIWHFHNPILNPRPFDLIDEFEVRDPGR